MTKHVHHIVPIHAGGTDDPDNLIELTIEEHADAHRVLFEQHGRWQDFIAWKALSGQIGKDEIRKELSRLAWLGKKHSKETIQKIKDARKQQVVGGWKWSEESKKRRSDALKGTVRSFESNQKTSNSMKGVGKPKLSCPHCGVEGGAPQMKQWHFDNCKKRKLLCV